MRRTSSSLSSFFLHPSPTRPSVDRTPLSLEKKEIIPLWHPSRARFSPLFSASVPFDLLAPPPPNRATTRLEAAAVVVVVLMVVVMVHPSSLSLSPRDAPHGENHLGRNERKRKVGRRRRRKEQGEGVARGYRGGGETKERRLYEGRRGEGRSGMEGRRAGGS